MKDWNIFQTLRNYRRMKRARLFDVVVSEWQNFSQTHYLPDEWVVNTGRSICRLEKARVLGLMER